MKQLFEFEDNKTFFGLDIYPAGVKLSDIARLPFAQFFNDSHVGSTMAFIDGENYIYLHDWKTFCKSFILHGTHRYHKDFYINKSNLYISLCGVLDGNDIETLDVGESSKRVLRKLLSIVEENSEIKDKLLKMHKLSLRTARDIILEKEMKKKW